MADIVTEASLGLNIALFVISMRKTRFDEADIVGIEYVKNILSEKGVNHIFILFTQLDALSLSEGDKEKLKMKWT